MLSDDAVSETQMVMGERVGGIIVDDDAMTADCLRVIFHSQEVVRQRIANLLVVRTAFGAGPRADRRLEYQRDQDQKTNARTATAQQLSYLPRPRGKKSDTSRNFRLKKTRRVFSTPRAEKKGVVPAA